MMTKWSLLTLGLMGLLFLAGLPAFAQGMPEGRMEDLFARMDANSDGVIERSEFRGNDEMFARMDTNGDGQVTLEEFSAGFRARQGQNPREPRVPGSATGEIRSRARFERREMAREVRPATGVAPAFTALDKDKDGVLSREEFPGSDEMFTRVDTDGDGSISIEEFRAGMELRRESRPRGERDPEESPRRPEVRERAPGEERPLPPPPPPPQRGTAPEQRRGGRGR